MDGFPLMELLGIVSVLILLGFSIYAVRKTRWWSAGLMALACVLCLVGSVPDIAMNNFLPHGDGNDYQSPTFRSWDVTAHYFHYLSMAGWLLFATGFAMLVCELPRRRSPDEQM